jgi:hypothetical protein
MGTIVLFSGSGAGDFTIEGHELRSHVTEGIFVNARRLLTARGEKAALDLLRSTPFEIFPARNHFNDEFHVLSACVPLPRYEEFKESRKAMRLPASRLAEAIMEANGPYIRFVAIDLELVASDEWSVFICHASEDKKNVVLPIVRHFENTGVRYWYDEAEILWGDSIVEKIEGGLAKARYVVVVVSKFFLEKAWAKKELRTALTMEVGDEGVRVLPLLVGKPERLLEDLPFLREKRYLEWGGDPGAIGLELQKLVGRRSQ